MISKCKDIIPSASIDNKELFCPVCSSSKINIYFRSGDFIVRRCRNCRMLFRIANLTGKYDWHSDNIYGDQQIEISARQAISAPILKRLEKSVNGILFGLNVLEIGVGCGALATALVSKGARYWGIEPSEYFFKQSLQFFPLLRGSIQNCTLEAAKLPDGYYDLIIMIDTLEHICYPLDYLMAVKKMLKEKGVLYLEVPCESLFKIKAFFRSRTGIYGGYPSHPDHVNFFTKNLILDLSKKAGFRKVVIDETMVLGDYYKMRIVMPAMNINFLKFISFIFRLFMADKVFKMGNLSVSLRN